MKLPQPSTVFKTAWTLGTTALYTLVVCPLILLVGPFNPSGRLAYRLGRLWAWMILKTNRVRIVVTGAEALSRQASYVFMANHASHLDPPVAALALPHMLRFIGKRSLSRIPLFGWASRLAGIIYIDRGDSTAAVATINRAVAGLKNGVSAFFFAEGTRSRDGRLQAFKKGGVALALRARLPIVPVTILDGFRLLPRGRLFIRAGTMRVVIGPAISTAGLDESHRECLLELVRGAIAANLEGEAA
jgi:1-acyl-sn-glycerol-3-phosphate acyltransferase